jgi:two-component system sensor histidine kinase KdpD
MERLINNLLDMTRLESGGVVLKKEWVPLQEVIGSALHALDRRLRGREIEINVGDKPLMLHVDPLAMEQVLGNLLDNAVEYTPQGSPIEISGNSSAGAVIFEVADHGPGLPPETETRVFEKFFRARPAEGRRGIGLGLAICRGFVEAHGGRITASNREGGGAVFKVVIPENESPPAVDGSA